MERIDQKPNVVDFTSYANYLSHTPESFSPSSGPPILFRRFHNAKLRILESDLVHAPLLAPFVPPTANRPESVARRRPDQDDDKDGVDGEIKDRVEDQVDDEAEDEVEELEATGVEIWAASDPPGGVRIPHSLIFLHAIRSTSPPSIHLELQSSRPLHGDYDLESTLELTLEFAPDSLNPISVLEFSLVPAPSIHPAGAPPSPPEEPGLTPHRALYDALSIAADMWSGLGDEDDEEGPAIMLDVDGSGETVLDGAAGDAVDGLPPPMPGSGGWITSDNIGRFFDEEGNWRGREVGAWPNDANELGEGAGIVRPREDDQHDEEREGVNGEETKWRRTD